MDFASPHLFIWLWLVPLAGVLFFFSFKRRNQRIKIILGRLAKVRLSKSMSLVKAGMVVLALIVIIASLARPRMGFEWTEFKREGVDIMIAIDVSNSMLAQDIKPNRLMRARREIVDLMGILKGDRVGLVAFAGDAFVQCPLTTDYDAVLMFLDYLNTDLIPTQGTDLGTAIDVSIAGLKAGSPEETEGQALILITDGEDLEGRGLAAAAKAKQAGVKLFTIGVGSKNGAPIPLPGGGFKKDSGGNVVVTKPDERALQELSVSSGGVFVRSVAGDMDLQKLYTEGIRATLKDKEFKAARHKVWYERFQWFLLVGILLLIAEFFIRDLVDERREDALKKVVMILAVILLAGQSTPSRAADLKAAHKDYTDGKFAEAAGGFLQAEIDDPNNPEHAYNRAVSQYRSKDFKGALDGFKKASGSQNPELAKNSIFNMGNTYVQMGKYDDAIETFEKSLQLAPEDKQIQENLAYAKYLKANPPPPQKNPDDKDQDDQDKKEDQDNKDQQNQQNQQNQDDKENKDDKENQDQQGQQDKDDQKEQDQKDQQNKEDENKEDQDQKDQQNKDKEKQEQDKEQQDQQKSPSGGSQEKDEPMVKDPGAMDKQQAEDTLRAVQEAPPQQKRRGRPPQKVQKDW